MKKRILSLVLVLCMVLPMIPLSVLPIAANSAVDGLYYDSPFARDVVFGDVPVNSWYSGQSGSLYEDNYNSKLFHVNTKYETYMKAFDEMVNDGTMADLVVDAGIVQSTGYDAGKWYNDIPDDVRAAMNATTADGYIQRQILGKGCKSISTIYDWVDPSDAIPGQSLANRPTEYLYAYTFDPRNEAGYDGPTNIPKLIIATGNQSDEKGAIYGTYYLINDILNHWQNSPVLEYLRHNVVLVVVPCLSPGGINQNSYWNANFVNINRNFESDGKSFKARLTGGYAYKAQEGGDWVPVLNSEGKAVSYTKVEAGTGTHVQYLAPGSYYNEDGSDARDSRYQNAGYAAYDQSESCVLRDLFQQNLDAFYYVDFHTNTSGPLSAGNWENVNWQALGTLTTEYEQKLVNAADWQIDRLSRHFYEDYNLARFGVTEGQKLGNATQSAAGYTSKDYGKACYILSTTLEGISGWPGSVLPGADGNARYSPLCQKADSENLGNWLIAVLGEYAYDGKFPVATYTTTFAPFSGNYPTIENLPIVNGNTYDRTDVPKTSSGFAALDAEKYPLVFHGNWSVGYKSINGDGSFPSDAETARNFTPYGVYVEEGNNKILYFAGDTKVWSTTAYMVINGGRRGSQMASSTNATAFGGASDKYAVWGNDATIRYTAEYSGTITIDVSDVYFNANTAQFAILHNGVQIGTVLPTATSATYLVDSEGNWSKGATTTPVGTSITIQVEKGDDIDFVNHNTNDLPGAYKLSTENMSDMNTAANGQQYETFRRGVNNFDISITYYETENDEVHSVYSGTNDGLWYHYPTVSQVKEFLQWSSTGALAGQTATINPELIEAGWIDADDTWEGAVAGYLNYLRAMPKLQTKSGWYTVAYEKQGDPCTPGTVASPINRYSLFKQSANLFSVSESGSHSKDFTGPTSLSFIVSENYYELQLSKFASSADLIAPSGTADKIEIDYDTDILPILSSIVRVGAPNTGTGIKNATAFLNCYAEANYRDPNYAGTLIRTVGTGAAASLCYEIPKGVKFGSATLQLTDLYIPTPHQESSRTPSFAVYLNGKALIDYTESTATTLKADVQDALETLGNFYVEEGDLIEVRFKRGSTATFLAPALQLDVGKTYSETWAGDVSGVNRTQPAYQPLFQWYTPATTEGGSDTLIVNGGVLANNSYAVINPYFTKNGIIDADDTYGEAVVKYKEYLRGISSIISKTNWQIGGMMTAGNPYSATGSDFSPVNKKGFLLRQNIYGMGIKEVSGTEYTYTGKYNYSNGGEVWVTDEYFEEMLNIYCCDYTWAKIGGKWTKQYDNVNLIDYNTKISDFDKTTLTYKTVYDTHGLLDDSGATAGVKGGTVHAWIPNGGELTTALRTSDNDASAYKGLMLRPGSGSAMAMGYTVPEKGAGLATLTLNSLTYGTNGKTTVLNGAFQWKVKINGVDQTTEWQTYTPASTEPESGDALASINEKLAALALCVNGGDMIQFCIKNSGSTIYVAPSISVSVDMSRADTKQTWTGDNGSDRTIPAEYQTFFVWYDAANHTRIATSGASIANAYAVVNPWLIQNGYVKTTDTYKEALQGYKKYLRTVSALPVEEGWQLVGMQSEDGLAYGTELVSIAHADFLGLNNIFGIGILESTSSSSYLYSYNTTYYNATGRSLDVWVTEDYFELQMQLLCDEIVCTDKKTRTFAEVENSFIPWDTPVSTIDTAGTDTTLTYSYVTTAQQNCDSYKTTGEISYAWNANGGNWGITSPTLVAENETKAAYKGMMLRPQENRGAGVMYTVPAWQDAGKAKLTINSLTYGNWGNSANLYNGSFNWAIAINDTPVTQWYYAEEVDESITEDATHARVMAMNEILSSLNLKVKGGDRIALCFRREVGGPTFYISPSVSIEIEKDHTDVRRVTLTSGGQTVDSILAVDGASIADLLAPYGADFSYGCYVNGVWYKGLTDLPKIDGYDVVIENVKITVSSNITIGATYSMNVFLPARNGATEAGIKIYGENIPATLVNGQYKVTVATAYAKDVLDTKVYGTPYYVINGKEVLGQSLTIRAEDILNTYITDEAYANEQVIAQAALDYATVAKAYFAGDVADEATLARLAGYDSQITGATTTQVTAGTDYTFTAASLQIGETINFVLAITATNGASVADLKENLTLYRNDVEMPIADEDMHLTYMNGKRALVVVVEGVPEKEFANTQTFCLSDGATLTYSVKDYCIRTFLKAEEAEKNMIRAIYAIGAAAEAYNEQ